MSFLLDALRKSEQAGRRRSAPTIHSEPQIGSARVSRADDLLPTLAFAAPAFLLMCWFGLRMFEVGPLGPDAEPQSVTNAANVTSQAVPADSAGNSVSGTQTVSGPQNTTPQFVRDENRQVTTPRTPVEQVDKDAVRPSGDAGQPGVAGSTAPTADPGEDPLAAASRAIQQAAEDAGQSGQSPAGTSTAKPPPNPPAASAPAPKQAAPERQNFIDYWELPENVRNQIPEMKITVLVYADQPEERFILVNGQRLYEGEELQAGLVLSEVRREGVVFSFRRYRFIFLH